LVGNPTFTLSCWVRLLSGNGLLGWGSASVAGGGMGLYYGFRGAGNILSVETGAGNGFWTAQPFSVDAWHNVVVTKTPGALNTTGAFWLDGVLGVIQGGSSGITPNISNSNYFAAGEFPSVDFAHCRVDDVRVYTRILSPADIGKIALGQNPTVNDPYLWWKLDGGRNEGTISVPDYGSAGLTGTFSKASWSVDVPTQLQCPAAPLETIVSSVDSGFSFVGSWTDGGETGVSPSGGYNNHFFYLLTQTGSSVGTWTFPGLPVGDYAVSVAWHPLGGSPSVPYRIYDDTTLLGTVFKNPQLNGRFVDGSTPWAITTDPSIYNGQSSYSPANSGGVGSYSFHGLEAGTYQVQASWRANAVFASNAPYRIYNNGVLLDTIRVNQKISASGGATEIDSGARTVNFQILGSYTISAGDLTVTVADDAADNLVNADAIRVTGGSLLSTWIIDDLDPAFNNLGTFHCASGTLKVTVSDVGAGPGTLIAEAARVIPVP
jgi:hypothetical protein